MANNAGAINLGPLESEAAMENPQNAAEAYLGSFAAILRKGLNTYVECEFLIGTNRLESKVGILYDVGINFITLYQPTEERYIVCDLYSLKFVTLYDITKRPLSSIIGTSSGQRSSSGMNGTMGNANGSHGMGYRAPR